MSRRRATTTLRVRSTQKGNVCMQSCISRSPNAPNIRWILRAEQAWKLTRTWSVLPCFLGLSRAPRRGTAWAPKRAGSPHRTKARFRLPLLTGYLSRSRRNRGQSDDGCALHGARARLCRLSDGTRGGARPAAHPERGIGQQRAIGSRGEWRAASGDDISTLGCAGNLDGEPSAELPQSGRSAYFTGSDPKNWVSGVERYRQVRYSNVYPGIDLVYYGNQQQLEYDFVVSPGAEPALIRMKIQGAPDAHINSAGDLVLSSDAAAVVQRKPLVYQEIEGRREQVESRYRLAKNDADGSFDVTLELGKHDASRTLTIDPVLVYSTYLSGSGNETIKGMAVDGEGNVYVTGFTASADFPIAGGLPAGSGGQSFPGTQDVFISKLTPQGDLLLYSDISRRQRRRFWYGHQGRRPGSSLRRWLYLLGQFPGGRRAPAEPVGHTRWQCEPLHRKAQFGLATNWCIPRMSARATGDTTWAALAVDRTGSAYITWRPFGSV